MNSVDSICDLLLLLKLASQHVKDPGIAVFLFGCNHTLPGTYNRLVRGLLNENLPAIEGQRTTTVSVQAMWLRVPEHHASTYQGDDDTESNSAISVHSAASTLPLVLEEDEFGLLASSDDVDPQNVFPDSGTWLKEMSHCRNVFSALCQSIFGDVHHLFLCEWLCRQHLLYCNV